jgi:Ca2+-transporting ATPase
MTVLQEIKANNALNALQKMSAPTCRVIRDKIEVKIPASELVVGDIVYLDDGCIIPADLRLYNTFELQINESALTGESKVINKNGELVLPSNTLLADQKNMAFASTIVTNGKGFGIVCNIGQNTEIGKIAQLLDDTDEAEIPLKKKLNTICKFLTIIGGISCIFVIGITLIVDLNQ